MKKWLSVLFIVICVMGFSSSLLADDEQPTVVNIKRMSLDPALEIANATIDSCRKAGFQVAVTVVDRGGNVQVVLRDVLAPDITLPISYQKAYTAMSFSAVTSTITEIFKKPFSVGKVDNIILHPGGVPVQASGTILGGVGVAGASDGHDDEKCAQDGVAAVVDALEMDTM